MSYVILDLEWNSAYSRQEHRFVNEIIEFGTVKVDDSFCEAGCFEELIAPKIGKKLSGKVQMVDLRGMSEEAAEELLIAMGLKVGTIGFEVTDDEEEVGIVLDQTVEEGTYVDAGTEIGLTVGKQMTYSYNVNISQPSYDYEEGTMVHIVVSTDSGQVLLTTDTDSFPYVEGRITEIPEGAGSVTLTWSYTYTEEEEVTIPVEGEDSGEGGTEPASESSGTTTTIVVNEVTEEREETRDLEFQKEY